MNLRLMVKYLYAGMTGVTQWLGYLYSAVYYIGVEYNFNSEICKASSYINLFVDAMYIMIDFAPNTLPVVGST